MVCFISKIRLKINQFASNEELIENEQDLCSVTIYILQYNSTEEGY